MGDENESFIFGVSIDNCNPYWLDTDNTDDQHLRLMESLFSVAIILGVSLYLKCNTLAIRRTIWSYDNVMTQLSAQPSGAGGEASSYRSPVQSFARASHSRSQAQFSEDLDESPVFSPLEDGDAATHSAEPAAQYDDGEAPVVVGVSYSTASTLRAVTASPAGVSPMLSSSLESAKFVRQKEQRAMNEEIVHTAAQLPRLLLASHPLHSTDAATKTVTTCEEASGGGEPPPGGSSSYRRKSTSAARLLKKRTLSEKNHSQTANKTLPAHHHQQQPSPAVLRALIQQHRESIGNQLTATPDFALTLGRLASQSNLTPGGGSSNGGTQVVRGDSAAAQFRSRRRRRQRAANSQSRRPIILPVLQYFVWIYLALVVVRLVLALSAKNNVGQWSLLSSQVNWPVVVCAGFLIPFLDSVLWLSLCFLLIQRSSSKKAYRNAFTYAVPSALLLAAMFAYACQFNRGYSSKDDDSSGVVKAWNVPAALVLSYYGVRVWIFTSVVLYIASFKRVYFGCLIWGEESALAISANVRGDSNDGGAVFGNADARRKNQGKYYSRWKRMNAARFLSFYLLLSNLAFFMATVTMCLSIRRSVKKAKHGEDIQTSDSSDFDLDDLLFVCWYGVVESVSTVTEPLVLFITLLLDSQYWRSIRARIINHSSQRMPQRRGTLDLRLTNASELADFFSATTADWGSTLMSPGLYVTDQTAESLAANGAFGAVVTATGTTTAKSDERGGQARRRRQQHRQRSAAGKRRESGKGGMRIPILDFADIEFKKPIGRGATAKVYRCVYKGQECAAKDLTDTNSAIFEDISEELIYKFCREALIFSHVRHPNIIKFVGVCLEPPYFYLVTELATHGTLRNVLDASARHRARTKLSLAASAPIDVIREVSELPSKSGGFAAAADSVDAADESATSMTQRLLLGDTLTPPMKKTALLSSPSSGRADDSGGAAAPSVKKGSMDAASDLMSDLMSSLTAKVFSSRRVKDSYFAEPSGTALGSRTRRDPLDDVLLEWQDRMLLAMDVARGMQLIHAMNIIHRDLNTNNILVCYESPRDSALADHAVDNDADRSGWSFRGRRAGSKDSKKRARRQREQQERQQSEQPLERPRLVAKICDFGLARRMEDPSHQSKVHSTFILSSAVHQSAQQRRAETEAAAARTRGELRQRAREKERRYEEDRLDRLEQGAVVAKKKKKSPVRRGARALSEDATGQMDPAAGVVEWEGRVARASTASTTAQLTDDEDSDQHSGSGSGSSGDPDRYYGDEDAKRADSEDEEEDEEDFSMVSDAPFDGRELSHRTDQSSVFSVDSTSASAFCQQFDIDTSNLRLTVEVGTVPYLAPELLGQLKVGKHLAAPMKQTTIYTKSVDIFAYGIVLWELLTEQEPYADLKSLAQIKEFVMAGRRLKLPKWIDAHWAQLVKRCWAHSAVPRPTFDEVVVVLAQYLSTVAATTVPDSRQFSG